MPKKGQKKLRGQPEIYTEVKGHIGLSVTKTGVQGLDELAAEMELSRSEFVEQIGRRLIRVVSQEEQESLKQALQHALGVAQDELLGRNLFEGRKAKGDRAIMLQQQIEQWEELLKKFE